MLLRELLPILEDIAPLRLAESWDNVGLLVGDAGRPVTRALLTIDYTREVAAEAVASGCDLVISYHPPIFEPLKRLIAPNPVFDALCKGIAIYSPHTALDAADGGTNDVLADLMGLRDRQPLRPITSSPWHYKLITFVPEAQVEQLADALFAAGAGHIGRYSHCSFRTSGTGTFLGEAGTNPTVGTPGQLEHADEIRIETIVTASRLGAVVQALRRSHPYEEPAFDIVQLTTPPEGKGMGRIGGLPSVSRSGLIEQIQDKLSVSHLLVAGPRHGEVNKAACCAGAGGSMIKDAIAAGCDLFLTGEARHHDALAAAAVGMTVVCALHSNTERLTLHHVASRLREKVPGVQFAVSETDHDPFAVV